MILLIGVATIVILSLLLLLVRPRPLENAMVVVSHYKEDLSWLSRIRYKYVVYKKDQDDDYPYNVPVNKGNEASAYLKYIIDHYDNLPEYVIFVHGHESDWHHEDSMVDKLNSLRITKDYIQPLLKAYYCARVFPTSDHLLGSYCVLRELLQSEQEVLLPLFEGLNYQSDDGSLTALERKAMKYSKHVMWDASKSEVLKHE